MDRLTLWQRIEGAGVFLASVVILEQVDAGLAWWSALLIFLAPDLSFSAYAADPKIGAWGYDLVHLRAFGAGLPAAGLSLALPLVAALGALWPGHAGFDRMLGYGLKSEDGFNLTHLGRIGRDG